MGQENENNIASDQNSPYSTKTDRKGKRTRRHYASSATAYHLTPSCAKGYILRCGRLGCRIWAPAGERARRSSWTGRRGTRRCLQHTPSSRGCPGRPAPASLGDLPAATVPVTGQMLKRRSRSTAGHRSAVEHAIFSTCQMLLTMITKYLMPDPKIVHTHG